MKNRPRRPSSRTHTRRPPGAKDHPRPAVPSGSDGLVQVAPASVLAESTAAIARRVLTGVFEENRRADRLLASELRHRRDLAAPDARFVSSSVFSLFRWWGWIAPLRLPSTEEQLLLACLLDASSVHPVYRLWARQAGGNPAGLTALGDAPSWTARTEGFKRLLGGRPVSVDPWRLFPDWFRSVAPLPPGPGPAKARQVGLIQSLQTRPPLWVRAQGSEPEKVWDELRAQNVKVWVHRRLKEAARLDSEVDLYHLPAFTRGRLEIQDLASQAVAHVASPDPGERWWDACSGSGGKALHLASRMQGKGVVIATDLNEHRLKEAVRRARRSPFRNLSTKVWDGKHVVGKPGRYDGVLVDAPCSGLGTWRRNPEARWTLDSEAVPRLSALQSQLLQVASAGVKVGGCLVYSVCTFSHAETRDVLSQFLQSNPNYQLDPFLNPISGTETDGAVQIWPSEADQDAMFVARMVRTA